MIFWWLLLLVPFAYSILIGTLPNVAYQSDDSVPVVFNGTCQECFCQAFFINTSSTYAAFNCYDNEKKCDLYHNYSTSYYLVTNASSKFFFYPVLPPLMTSTESIMNNSTLSATSLPTTSNSFQLRWNSMGTTVFGITGSAGTGADQLNCSRALALYSSNTLYVADRCNNRIQKFLIGASNGTTVAGQADGTSGSTLNSLKNPCSVAVDLSGNVYVTDTFNHRVVFWISGATSGTIVAGNGTAGSSNNQLNSPYGCAFDSNSDTLYVADSNNHRIVKYISNASSGMVVAGGNGNGPNNTQLNLPKAIYFDSSSNSLYIVNTNGNNVVRWVLGDTSWTLVAGSINGSAGRTSTLLNGPFGVTLDSMGNVYVADSGNARVQFFLAGQFNGTTIAGVTGTQGNTSALFLGPYAVVVDRQFNLYVADYFNHRVQKFSHY